MLFCTLIALGAVLVWKVPEYSQVDGLFTENQQTIEGIKREIPT